MLLNLPALCCISTTVIAKSSEDEPNTPSVATPGENLSTTSSVEKPALGSLVDLRALENERPLFAAGWHCTTLFRELIAHAPSVAAHAHE